MWRGAIISERNPGRVSQRSVQLTDMYEAPGPRLITQPDPPIPSPTLGPPVYVCVHAPACVWRSSGVVCDQVGSGHLSAQISVSRNTVAAPVRMFSRRFL